MLPALYLVPTPISDAPLAATLPAENLEVLRQCRFMIVENVRTIRRFLKKCDPAFDINAVTFFELNRHTDISEISSFLEPLREGNSVALLSEAGCPAVADPGAVPVGIAQREGLRVVPLVGPSSILMALMASGFNGQGFSFSGYLPIDEAAKIKRIKDLESISSRQNMTQIFIETPYRNNKLLKVLSSTLRPNTLLCVAADITDPERESIRTLTAAKWSKVTENYDKRPAIFLLYAGSDEAITSSHNKSKK